KVLEPESELILAELLRLAPEVIAPQLAQHVEQTLVLRSEPSILAALGTQHRLEALDAVRESVGRIRHATNMQDTVSPVSGPSCRESTCHQDHCAAWGARTRRIWMRAQSSPSNRAES